MTREEAIKIINSAMTSYGEDAIDYEEIFEAKDIAIYSLEAWKKIKEEIKFIQEAEMQVYGKANWNFSGKCLNVIDKHLKEVEQ